MRKPLLALALLGAVAAWSPSAQADPSLQDVDSAVRAGRLGEAQSMMLTVLHDHPNSVKAHFVEAEVLERMGRIGEARGELERAEQLQPGLTSIPVETVQRLRVQLASGAVAPRLPTPEGEASFPWIPVLLIGGAIALLILVWRSRRPMVAPMATPIPGTGVVSGPYGGVPYGTPMGGGGIGSGILGGLATGAAVGAGMVAGEALAHEFIGNHDRPVGGNWDDGGRVASVDTSDLGVSGDWDGGAGGGDIASGMGGGDDWS